ncbi:MAG: 2'-5' RNA ligase family protein, partial [Solirubrobacteraceae bacterium]
MDAGRVRLFVALELPADTRSLLTAWAGGVVAALPGVRPVATESLHATLVFIGARPAAAVDAIAVACREAVAPLSPTVPAPVLGEAVWLPRRRPRVLAVALVEPSGALTALQAAL